MSYSLRLSVTDRCSLRCVYCMPVEGGSFVSWREVLSFDEIVRFARVMRSDFGLNKIRLTGGEPLLRPGLSDLVAELAALGIEDLVMTTNGQWLAEHAAPLKRAGLRRVNVSLDSLDAANYRMMARGGELRRSLDGIEAALSAGLAPLKLNMVVMRGKNDHEILDLARFGLARGCTVRFLELMPIGIAGDEFDRRFITSAEVRERLAAEFELTPLPETSGASSREFRAAHRDGRVTTLGFISPYSHPFCAGCRRLRLTAGGVLMGCLSRSAGVPLAPLLRGPGEPDRDALARAVANAVAVKRDDGAFAQLRDMAGIGG
jgi:cyclic pyranopterin phosphate synthase